MLKNFLKPRFQPVLSRRFESHLLNRPTVSCSLKPKKSLNILFFANKHNSLSQRMALELRKRQHNITVHEINEPVEMTKLAFDAQPDLILCPFLTKNEFQKKCFLIPTSLAGLFILESRATVA